MKKIFLVCMVLLGILFSNVTLSKAASEQISTLNVSSGNEEDITSKYKVEKIGSSVVKTTILESGNYIIEGTSSGEVSEKIEVVGGIDATITIKNVKLFYNSTSAGSPIYINPTSNVELILDDENSIRAPQYYPAIGFYGHETTGTLTISATNDGKLKAYGGGGDASGIGGASKFARDENSSRDSGNIIINGGNLYVDSLGKSGAAIGSASPNGKIDKIEINGGTIEAVAGGSPMAGAAIGSGSESTVNSIVINGGNIIAKANYYYGKNSDSAAIGSGGYGLVSNITINGGNITTLTDEGVGIGGSYGSKAIEKIEINGGTITTNSTSSTIKNTIGMTDGSSNAVENIEINGGSIKTKAFSSPIKNKNNDDLTLLKLENINSINNVAIDGNSINVNSLHEGDSSLYLYVSKNDHKISVTANEEKKDYIATYNDTSNSFTVKEDSINLPWEEINFIPTITANDIEIKVGSEFNEDIAKKYATAFDQEENDLTDSITIIDYNVNPNIIGKYQITYFVKDSKNASSKKTINVTVYDDFSNINFIPTLSGNNKSFNKGTKITEKMLLEGIEAKDKENGDLTERIEIISNDIVEDVVGTYHVTYKVLDNDLASATLTITVEILEVSLPSKPTIFADNITLELNSKFDNEIAKNNVTAKDGNGNDITNLLKVVENDVDTTKEGKYKVTFEVSDQFGQTTRKTIEVNVIGINKPIDNNINYKIIAYATIGIIFIGIIGGYTYYFIKRKKK